MNTNHRYFPSVTALLAGLLLAASASAETRHLAMPSYQVNAGAVLEVPLTLDNAAGLASVQVQVNFDPEVLELLNVKSGPLGDAFEMSRGDGAGFTQLTFFRAESLTGGSGRLASLRFRANQGAATDLASELAIADVSLSDATAVVDLRQKDTVTLSNGHVAVSAQSNIDNAGNGLPDWWEDQYQLDPFINNMMLDPERDGLPNLLEYAFGGNPKIADMHQRGVRSSQADHGGQSFLSIGYFRRKGDDRLSFRVQESPDLEEWNNLPYPQQLHNAPMDMGDGTEYIEVRGTIPITGPGAQSNGFLRVEVERTE